MKIGEAEPIFTQKKILKALWDNYIYTIQGGRKIVSSEESESSLKYGFDESSFRCLQRFFFFVIFFFFALKFDDDVTRIKKHRERVVTAM